MTHKIFLLIALMSVGTLTNAQDKETRQKLLGDWIYFGLEYQEPMSAADREQIEIANKQNKNLIVSFLEDGTYVIWNKTEGKKDPYAKGILELTKMGKHLKIEGLEGDIEKVDAEELRLTGPNKPVMIFKRYKE